MVPIIISFLLLGGFLLINTNKVYKIAFENRGPICMNSTSRSISSNTIKDKGDL